LNAKKIKYFVIPVIILLLILYIQSVQNNREQDEELISPLESPLGYGLVLYDDENQKINKYEIELLDNNDFSNKLKFINNAKSSDFSLMIFVDYKQIPFYVGNDGKLYDSYEFKLEKGDDKDIPIRFSTKQLTYREHSLLFYIVAGSKTHASDLGESSSFFGIPLMYNLILSDQSTVKDVTDSADVELFESSSSFFVVNQNFSDKTTPSIPPLEITSKPGEETKLAVRVSNISNTGNYLFWLSVDWQQYNLTNSLPFLFFNIPPNRGAYKEIMIKAPTQPGKYEIVGFLVSNPWSKVGASLDPITVDTSYRFTLTVG